MPKVSVIMPSLNVVAYIQECIESVIHQTLKDIEILCVDAGSTDGTLEILEGYAALDSRIRLIQSLQKSYGYQMNLGLREAQGEYIGIVETDDYILPEMYEELYTYAVEHDADFVKSDFDVFTTLPEGEKIFNRCSLKVGSSAQYDVLFTSKDYMDSKKTIDTFIWNGIYRSTFLQKHQIKFLETPGAAFQDCGFRYQVAMNVERGFFLDRSFYRYRRDNASASTYNSKCVLFNLTECENILRIAQERGWMADRKRARFLARETAIVAHRPYVELLTWGTPAPETAGALTAFHHILHKFMEQNILNQESAPEEDWLALRMMVDNLEFYEYYVRLKAEMVVSTVKRFLMRLADAEVVLFGCGQVGAAAYSMIRNSGLQNAATFCDNDPAKWETNYMGRPVLSPEAAVRQFPAAHFVIANRVHQDAIKKQLLMLGISEERILVYNLSIDPMFCTNMSLRMLIQ